MRHIAGLTFILAIVAVVTAQDCMYNNCAQCTADTKCGWCAATQLCLPGTKTGPSGNNFCLISWEFGSCPSCDSFTDCRSCQVHDADCYWCDKGEGSCVRYGSQLGCPVTNQCPCGDWTSCSECVEDPACQWCDSPNGGVCATGGLACPNNGSLTHTCPCGSFLACDTCKEARGCAWCDTTSKCYNRDDANGCDFHQVGNTTCEHYCKNAAKNCLSCNQLQGCVWCSDTKSCTDEDTAQCQREEQCAACSHHMYCDPCLDDVGCQWCDGPQPYCGLSCPSGFAATTCLSYCNGLTEAGCSSCNSHTGCGWCEDSKVCVDLDRSTGCLLAHTCTDNGKGKCGFDGGAFVGGMFLVIGLAILGGGGYAFYRYKTGKSSSYNQLH